MTNEASVETAPVKPQSMSRRVLATLTSPVPLTTAIAAFLPALVIVLWLTTNSALNVPLLVAAAPLLAFVVGWILGLLINNYNFQRTERILDEYVQVLEQVAQGDLTARLVIPKQDNTRREGNTVARLAVATNQMLDRLQRIVKEISRTLQRLDMDTQAILDATARQITMANEQDAVVTETTATVNEVRATVTETAERAQSVAETAQVSVDISRTGSEAVNQTVSGMQLIRRRVEDIADNILVLSEHTQQIGEIIAAVNNLADQSRMLALNASVEAARAGEEGKGFAVVAMEVRNLADQNRDATVQVREILGEIQRATNAAVMVTEEGSKGVDTGQVLVNEAGEAIRNLASAIEEAALAAMQIAASTRQQTIGMDQLTAAMKTIKHATTETVSSTMQVEASVQRLRDAATKFSETISDLKV